MMEWGPQKRLIHYCEQLDSVTNHVKEMKSNSGVNQVMLAIDRPVERSWPVEQTMSASSEMMQVMTHEKMTVAISLVLLLFGSPGQKKLKTELASSDGEACTTLKVGYGWGDSPTTYRCYLVVDELPSGLLIDDY
jgi:hypothetical protein